MFDDILVYDMEVFKYDWFITIFSINTNSYIKIHNDYDHIKNFYDKNINSIWAGHNIGHYDNIILKALLVGASNQQLKNISNAIIEKDMGSFISKSLNLSSIQLYSMDVMQDAIRYSLKEVEGYLGMSIEESNVPFDLKRPLTENEINEVFKYNQHDVDATLEEIILRFDRLMNKLQLLKEYNLPASMIEYTNAKLCAEILDADYKKFNDGLQPYDLSIAPISIEKYIAVIDFFTKCEKLDYSRELKIDIADVPHVLSNGGIHGAIKNFIYFGEIWLLDVSSYYPNMMINFNLCSRAMSHPENFSNLVNTRMKAKEQKGYYSKMLKDTTDEKSKEKYIELKDKYSKQSDALKLPINTASGAMKAPFSKLFDERNNNWMCITGQLLLVDLIEKLEPYCLLVQSNTDGIVIIPINKGKCDKVCKIWQEKTGLILEKTIAKKIFQKDVNNYILLDNNDHIKSKGGYVAQYHNEERYSDMLRRNMEILDDAVVDYLMFDKPIEKTIKNENIELLKYQIIKKLGGMYDDVVLYKYDDNGDLLLDRNVNRVNRIFATTDKHYGKLMKKHNKKEKYDSVEGCPDNCLVINKDIRSYKAKDISLDYDWYISLAKLRIIDFVLSEETKRKIKKRNKLDLWEDVEKVLKEVKNEKSDD